MKQSTVKISIIAVAVCTALFWGCGGNQEPTTGTQQSGRLPQDVLVKCTVSQDVFNTWFMDGKPSENGTVMPANSVTFPHENNCSFYTWSEQMFLWIVSPVSGGKYTLGNTVLESPIFYDVTTATNGKRFMTKHEPGVKTLKVLNHITQQGPHNLPMVADKEGNLFELEADEATGMKPMLKNAAGATEELASVEDAADGTHIFKNKAGKVIAAPKPILRHDEENILREVKLADRSFYFDRNGKEHTEVGQATSDVLFAQNGSMVYYLLMVNDVYAFYTTAAKNKGAVDTNRFPITAAERDQICAYARQNGATLPDSNALAIELKTSFVEAINLPGDPESYIYVEAELPGYDTLGPTLWKANPKKNRKAKLAMIGMHVVGSVAGHAEMSWATFEHINNAPNAAYQYLNTKGDTIVVPQDTGSNYLLCNNAATGAPFNVSHAQVPRSTATSDSSAYIRGKNNMNISASNTMLTYAFGSQMNTITNQEDRSSAAANSEIIAINNAIIKMLVGKDVRKNYYLVGATWTQGGVAPNGNSYNVADTTPGVAIGANLLANSTMETYFQLPLHSCFFCHSSHSAPSLTPGILSHIYTELQPLPTVPGSMKK